MSSNSTINQGIEIVQTLCRGGLAFATLLATLQTRFPSTGWTSTLLTLRLAQGVKQGRFIAIGSVPGGTPNGYGLNKNMLRLNLPANGVYAQFCSQALPLGCTPSCSIGSASGTGAGAGSSS